ncbi:hypothetical protein P4054_00160 [Pseudomonas aeruginosa]|nr:hypothetical protein [Pseudomonas aeruginosa]
MQPDEGISLQVMTKDQGLGKGMQLRTGPLQLSFSETYHAARFPMPTSVCCWRSPRATSTCSCARTRWSSPGSGATN